MFSVKNIILFYLAYCCRGVTSDLNLPEGASCVTDGFNGTCVPLFKCTSATLSHLYLNVGFLKKIADFPEICKYDEKEPTVCCTDCDIDKNEKERYQDIAIGPLGVFHEIAGSKATKKCYDYFRRLPYPCKGLGNVSVRKIYKEFEKCHEYRLEIALAVGGRDARRWEFPHMALLGYGDDEDNAQWLCGGSVISERYILTAGHCVFSRTVGDVKFVALGILKRTDPKDLWKIYKVKRAISHPGYQPPSKYHDIALLETETEINFGKDLLPACLDIGIATKLVAEASGWGRLGHNKDLAENLQVVNIDQFDELECLIAYPPHRHLKNGYNHTTQMCYGSHTQVIDTCAGDSGGPLQVSDHECLHIVTGVTSFGKDCGVLGSPGIYTRVQHYVPWIEDIVWPVDE